ncbi:MAG: histone deacetylase [Longimicrobiales bacterium]|nr:histone deacetylase [Longimicrobiales bacterium]
MSKPSVVWSPAYEVDIGPHVFPTAKYRLVRDRLLSEGIVGREDLVEAEPVTDVDLARVHTPEYLAKIRDDRLTASERIALEVPFSQALAHAGRVCCGGTLLASRLALRDGIAVHLGGGFHHAFPDYGEGFCLLNDSAVASAALLDEGAVSRVMVVDLDVHQGNGTAAIFADDARVFTLSMHQERNYPALKPPSDLDLGLDDGTGDASYLAVLEASLPSVVERFRPQLALYLAGADPYREDQLGGLALTLEGLRRRDAYVMETLRERGVAVAVTLAGGYALRTNDTVTIHATTVREAVKALHA